MPAARSAAATPLPDRLFVFGSVAIFLALVSAVIGTIGFQGL